MIDIAITGAAGRMGQRLIALASQDKAFRIVAAVERPDHPLQSRDAGEISGIAPIGLPITFDLTPRPGICSALHFPPPPRVWLKTCRGRGIAMLIGTTGLHPPDHASID